MKNTTSYGSGHTLSYAEYGDPHGRPILIQHGLIASITDHHLFHRLIETGARLIFAARPGYGESSPYPMKNIGDWANIMSVLIAELGLELFDVLGISSGAPYSYAIGHRFPDQVRNIYILSGTPALYEENVLACWPYPSNKNASLPELQALAYELFFSHLSPADRARDEIKDSMMNDCFGIAQDFQLRCQDWGFKLSEVASPVWMRHSRSDDSVPLVTVEMTAKLLPNCRLEIRPNDPHFSPEVLDDFLSQILKSWHES